MKLIDYFKSTIYFHYFKEYNDPNTTELKTKLFYTTYNDKSLLESITINPEFSVLIDIYRAINPKEQLVDSNKVVNWLMSSPDKAINEVQWLDISLFAEMFAPLCGDLHKKEALAKFLLHRIQKELLLRDIEHHQLSNIDLQNIKDMKILSEYIAICIKSTQMYKCKDIFDFIFSAYHRYIYEYVYQQNISIAYLHQNCSSYCVEYECPTKCAGFVDLENISEEFLIGYDLLQNMKKYKHYTKLINDYMNLTGCSFEQACKNFKKFQTKLLHSDEVFDSFLKRMNSPILQINTKDINIELQEVDYFVLI